jgi:hypothetical protein
VAQPPLAVFEQSSKKMPQILHLRPKTQPGAAVPHGRIFRARPAELQIKFEPRISLIHADHAKEQEQDQF